MKVFFFGYVLLLAAAPAVAAPVARVGPAQVRAGSNGGPCFTVEREAEQRDGTAEFRAVTVKDALSHSVLWKMALPIGRTFALTHSTCIPYAGRVPALPQTPAVPLAERRVYQVQLDVYNNDPRAPRAYAARFCVTGPAQAVRQLAPGEGCTAGP